MLGPISISLRSAVLGIGNPPPAPKYLFAGTFGGGVFRSDDGGANWAAVNAGLSNLYIYALNNDGTFLFAGCGGGKKVYRSQDNGTAWILKATGLDDLAVAQNFHFYDNKIYAALDGLGGMCYYSANNGDNWSARKTGLPSKTVYAIVNIGTILFAGVYGLTPPGVAVYKSTDGGASWSACASMASAQVYSLFANGTNLFAGTTDHIELSTDGGASWITVHQTSVNCDYMEFCKLGTDLYQCGTNGVGVVKSTNGGLTWSSCNTGLPATPDVRCICTDGINLYAGTYSNGVYKSADNGAHWSAVNNGLTNLNIRELDFKG